MLNLNLNMAVTPLEIAVVSNVHPFVRLIDSCLSIGYEVCQIKVQKLSKLTGLVSKP